MFAQRLLGSRTAAVPGEMSLSHLNKQVANMKSHIRKGKNYFIEDSGEIYELMGRPDIQAVFETPGLIAPADLMSLSIRHTMDLGTGDDSHSLNDTVLLIKKIKDGIVSVTRWEQAESDKRIWLICPVITYWALDGKSLEGRIPNIVLDKEIPETLGFILPKGCQYLIGAKDIFTFIDVATAVIPFFWVLKQDGVTLRKVCPTPVLFNRDRLPYIEYEIADLGAIKKPDEKIDYKFDISSQDYCPCGSGKKYLDCCRDKAFKWKTDGEGHYAQCIPQDKQTIEALKRFMEMQEKILGRPLGPGDKIFPDIDPVEFSAVSIVAMMKAGVAPDYIYAYVKTDGLMLTDMNISKALPKDIEEFRSFQEAFFEEGVEAEDFANLIHEYTHGRIPAEEIIEYLENMLEGDLEDDLEDDLEEEN
jgi:hypothetical protein